MTTRHSWNPATTPFVALFAGLAVGLFDANGGTIPTTAAYLTNTQEIVDQILRADAEKHLNLQEYSVVRRYVLRNTRLGHDNIVKVRWSYVKGTGKTYQVLESQGAEGMGKKVLDRVMEAEAQSAAPGRQENSRLTREHYDFRLLGVENFRGRPCYLLELKPKIKSRFLLNGKAWIDAKDFSPVRVEGRPSASMSFFVGKPYIIQEFQKVGDFYMASYNRSHSQSHIIGDSELTIEYSEYDVKSIEGTRVALRQCAPGSVAN